jgi:hypothetical protein
MGLSFMKRPPIEVVHCFSICIVTKRIRKRFGNPKRVPSVWFADPSEQLAHSTLDRKRGKFVPKAIIELHPHLPEITHVVSTSKLLSSFHLERSL